MKLIEGLKYRGTCKTFNLLLNDRGSVRTWRVRKNAREGVKSIRICTAEYTKRNTEILTVLSCARKKRKNF